jgi:DNA-binding NarL/FixJ family response regulator
MNGDPVLGSVVLADDHPMLLRGLRDIVAAEPDFTVVGTAHDGQEALALIQGLKPQLAVLDLAMPTLDGLGVLKAISHDVSPPRVVILTALISDQQLLDAITSGVWGLLLKESAPEELVGCLRAVAMGKKQMPEAMVERAIARNAAIGSRQRILNEMLTAREREIAMLVSDGQPNSAIADALGLSPGTVRIHLHNIYIKLDIRNRTSLAALVLNQGV